MGFVYAAFSLKLNQRSLDETGQIYLFKFGFAKARHDLEERLNTGFEERRRRDRLGERSAPLALCEDWEVIECLEHHPDPAAKDVEDAVHEWCRMHFTPFALLETLKSEINGRAGQPFPSPTYVSWNGLGDVVCLDHDRVADEAYMASIGRPNDHLVGPLIERAIARVRLELSTFPRRLPVQTKASDGWSFQPTGSEAAAARSDLQV